MTNTISVETLIETISEYDLIIDARSPREYALSHVPRAVNFYALSDEEHKEIGTIYKQLSPFEARLKGASYVCMNAARHIEKLYPAHTPKAKIAIYCARGGMRSSSLGTIFSSIGYRIDRVIGGYKSYRQFVTGYLDTFEPFDLITIRGNTGSGKSDLLQKLSNVIDLETLANHYGSTFGGVNGAQPSQKEFQNRLVHALLSLDRTVPAFVEGESTRMGSLTLPPRLFEIMRTGVQVQIETPLEDRVNRIVRMYREISSEFFLSCMEKITPYISKKAKDEATFAFSSGDLHTTARILLTEYYDKVYKKIARVDYKIFYKDEFETLEKLKAVQKGEK